MSDVKVSACTASGALATTDIVYVVVDPGGTPLSRKSTIAQVRTALLPIVISGAEVSGILPEAKGGTGLSALGTGVATLLGTPSSANFAAACSDETGTGLLTFATMPSFSCTGGVACKVWNSAGTFRYSIAPSNIVADRILSLPFLSADDTLVSLAASQALSNKTISGASNTLTVRLASDVSGTLPVANGGTGQVALTSAMGALSVDWSLAPSFTKTLAAGANAITFSNKTAGQTIVLRLTGAASTVTWPTILWAGGVAPTQTASGKDVYTFFYDGTDVYGSFLQAFA